MSQRNVELVQASYAAYQRGHQGLLDALDHRGGQWQGFTVEVERIVSVGSRVVSPVHQRGRGKLSGAPVELRVAYVHPIRNDKRVRWEMFATWERALEAAGLRE